MGILKGLAKTAANMSGLGLAKRQLGALGLGGSKKKKAPAIDTENPAARTSYGDSWDSMARADAAARRKAAPVEDESMLAAQEAARLKKLRMKRVAATQGK